MNKILLILFLCLLSFYCHSKEYTDGDKKLSVKLLVYENHLYLLFDNHSVVHHPDCPCFDLPDDGNHSYLD
jgi:hypothetical protein